jgi:drug/metabolite transporter (DMT)-like permease
MFAIRYVISGCILLVVFALKGVAIPRGRELWQTAACGTICIGIGNGFLGIAENYIPSGMAALFYTATPFWMAGIDALLPHGKKPLGATVIGLLVGLSGVIYLIYPAAIGEGFHGKTVIGFLLMEVSSAGWVLGSLLQKRVKSTSIPFVSGAIQQLGAGLALFIPATLMEHLPGHVGMRPVSAVVYLIVFGTIIGYSAFVYSMAKLPVAIVSIYTFVNPIIALFLGWVFFREPFGMRGVIAMMVIFAGIALVRRSESASARQQMVFASEHEVG